MSEQSKLTLVAHPDGYFHELVTEALGHQRIEARPETEFYLVKLLSRFISSESLFSRDAEGNLRDEPLALMIQEAIEQPVVETQRSLFRHVGDVSLYTAGYFQDSLNRKLVDVDYYIGVGGSAYQQVAARAEENLLKSIYSELSEKFGAFVEVLAEISDKTCPKSEKDLLRAYELWVRTRSERAAKVLQEAGILPNSTVKKNLQ